MTESARISHPLPIDEPDAPTLRTSFIEAMSRIAASVAVVTTDGEAGRFGLTVSAMCSVTADPPTLLVCINRKNPIGDAIRTNGRFAVNSLRADQRRVAEAFAGRPRRGEPYDFDISRWHTGATGSPLLTGAIAQCDCLLQDTHEVGTHTIFIGAVQEALDTPGSPLVYGRRAFGELHKLPDNGHLVPLFPEPIWDEPEDEEILE